MLDGTLTPQGNAIAAIARPDKQRRRLSIAVVLLLCALIVLVIRDRDYWFGSSEPSVPEEQQAASTPGTPAQTSVQLPSVPAAESPKPLAKRSAKPETAASVISSSKSGATGTTAERVQMASINAPLPATEYPLLAGQMSVQGSVLMQALIAPDGAVEDLRVLSGPTILVSAAREAVRQWRFKPYYENGKPVETQARVTVNFTINVSDTTARIQQPSITSDGAL
ncbi:MAG TPA: TonB family protein [Terriglobales bacterium]|nr:TonB family protein [Terriglobales bacterium]